MNWINLNRIEGLSKNDAGVPMYAKVIKAQEEVGEMAQAFLGTIKAKNVSASSGGSDLDILEEACDVINVVVDIVNNLGFTDDEKFKMFNKKLDKWESKQNKHSLVQTNDVAEMAKKLNGNVYGDVKFNSSLSTLVGVGEL